MAQQETLALVATAVDKASGPLREISRALVQLKKEGDLGVHSKSLAGFSKELEKLTRYTGELPRHAKHVESYARQWKEFGRIAGDTAGDVAKEFVPALGKLSFSTVGAAASIGLLTAAVKKYGESQHELLNFATTTGFDVRQIEAYRAVLETVGVTADETRTSLKQMSEAAANLKRPDRGQLGQAARFGFRREVEEMRAIEFSNLSVAEKRTK